MERPTMQKHESRDSRSLTRFWRRCAAWDMAHILADDVSERDYEKAYDILNRCTRYALAQMRHDESETAQNHNARWYVHEGELLDKRYERLSAELKPYGMEFTNSGYFCVNVSQVDPERHVITSNGYLHFFEY